VRKKLVIDEVVLLTSIINENVLNKGGDIMFWRKKRGWFGEHLEENIKALNEGDLSRIPWIFCVFSEKDPYAKLQASKVLSNIIKGFEFDDIIRIDTQMRQTTSLEWSINWHEQRIDNFFTPTMSIEERQAVLIFASFNPNGFIREEAVRRLSEYDGSLPYIILRLNDWVLQVRQAASEAFDKRLHNLAKGEMLIALPFAERLKLGSRGSHGENTQKFFDKLVSQEHREDLIKGLQSDNLRTRRICIAALFEAHQPDIELAFYQLKHEPEPFLRAMLFENLCKSGQDMREPSHILLKDKFAHNRILALKYLQDKQDKNIYQISMKLIFDKNAYVRAFARSIIKQHSLNFDFRSAYLRSIGQFTEAAILGLGEIGQVSDTEIIEGYLNDRRIAVVRAVLISLMRLNSEKYKTLIIEKLTDHRIGVIKTAQKLILKYHVQDYSRIYEIFCDTPYEYTKLKCGAILFKASKWESLTYMLEALSAEEESIRKFALHSIQRWIFAFNRSFIQASKQQKEKIQILVEKQNEKLSNSLIKELLFLLN
jgi:HEAT repeat protein